MFLSLSREPAEGEKNCNVGDRLRDCYKSMGHKVAGEQAAQG